LINYFEGISSAYQNGVADRKMFETSFSILIGKWYARLEGFVDAYREDCHCAFGPFAEVGKVWKEQYFTAAKPVSSNMLQAPDCKASLEKIDNKARQGESATTSPPSAGALDRNATSR
jgi:hypothetical protein